MLGALKTVLPDGPAARGGDHFVVGIPVLRG